MFCAVSLASSVHPGSGQVATLEAAMAFIKQQQGDIFVECASGDDGAGEVGGDDEQHGHHSAGVFMTCVTRFTDAFEEQGIILVTGESTQ